MPTAFFKHHLLYSPSRPLTAMLKNASRWPAGALPMNLFDSFLFQKEKSDYFGNRTCFIGEQEKQSGATCYLIKTESLFLDLFSKAEK
jgi:hypothetical protein